MNNNNLKKAKTTQGRQKIEIKKIESISNRQVTFSKRRHGLFKKAAELCILSGAEVAIIVKSPGKRIFAFGHTSVDAVTSRYLAENSPAADAIVVSAASTGHRPSEEEFNQHYDLVSKELEAEKRRSAVLEESKKAADDGDLWWRNESFYNLGLAELEHYRAALEELKKNASMRIEELMLLAKEEASKSMPPSTILGVNPGANPDGYGSAERNFINQVSECGTSVVPHGSDLIWRGPDFQ